MFQLVESRTDSILPSLIEYLTGGTNIWDDFPFINQRTGLERIFPRIRQNDTLQNTLIVLGESHIGKIYR